MLTIGDILNRHFRLPTYHLGYGNTFYYRKYAHLSSVFGEENVYSQHTLLLSRIIKSKTYFKISEFVLPPGIPYFFMKDSMHCDESAGENFMCIGQNFLCISLVALFTILHSVL